MNTPVSFEIAKLLAEKGFDNATDTFYWLEDELNPEVIYGKTPRQKFHKEYGGSLSAPTIAQVVMWLYEMYGIWIYTVRDYDLPKFGYAIQQPNIYSVLSHLHNDFNSSTEAYSNAIEFTLNNLI